MILRNLIYQRLLLLTLVLCSSRTLFADFIEDFSDGDYLNSPTWVGDYQHFGINAYGQLQTKASAAATSYLATASTINHEAEWSFFCRIATTPSAYNYMRFYLISSEENPLVGDGWFVQIGGANKNITLCQQIDGEKETVIASDERKKILDMPDNKIFVRVRLSKGTFTLESKVINQDSDYVIDGTYATDIVSNSQFVSILVKNSSKTGQCYYADDIIVQGQTVELPEEDDEPILPNDSLSLPAPTDEPIYLAQDYFTPNSDGINDMCYVYYNLPAEGFMAHIQVLTANGLFVKTLSTDEPLPAAGALIWNGETEKGMQAQMGVYVLMCEFTHAATGQIIRKKIPVALTL